MKVIDVDKMRDSVMSDVPEMRWTRRKMTGTRVKKWNTNLISETVWCNEKDTD